MKTDKEIELLNDATEPLLSICCGMPVVSGICQECKENA